MFKLALLGKSVSRSLSPVIYDYYFKELGLEFTYDLISVAEDDLVSTFNNLVSHGYTGFNVTNPYKKKLLPYVDNKSKIVAQHGCANVFAIRDDSLYCDNTDGIGFCDDVGSFYNFSGKKVIVFGAGGVAGVIIAEMISLGAAVSVAARNVAKASSDFSRFENIVVREKIDLSRYDVVLNATGVRFRDLNSMWVGDISAVDLYYDLSYGSGLLSGVNSRLVFDGKGMLVHQAAYAMEFWTGRLPSKESRSNILSNLRCI